MTTAAAHTKSKKAEPGFRCAPVVAPQGNGTYLVKPGKPSLGRGKLTVKEAAARARVSDDTILRLYDSGCLEGERPSPRKLFIFEDSLRAHLDAVKDKEFWERKSRLGERTGSRKATATPTRKRT
jgi:excisionase family DNA binding protein